MSESATETAPSSKRARTLATLTEAALEVFAQNSFEMPVVDDFIRAANVSRGTFYNYFRSLDELMAHVAAHLADTLNAAINSAWKHIDDPVERLSIATRYYVKLASENETHGWFLVRMIPQIGGPLNPSMRREALRSIQAGCAEGRLHTPNPAAAIDLGLGMIAMAIRHNLSRGARPYSPELVAQTNLMMMGMSRDAAARIANRPLPPIEHAVIKRAKKR